MQVQFSIERKHLIGAAIAALVIFAAVGWGLYFRSESAAAGPDPSAVAADSCTKRCGAVDGMVQIHCFGTCMHAAGHLFFARGIMYDRCANFCAAPGLLPNFDECRATCLSVPGIDYQ